MKSIEKKWRATAGRQHGAICGAQLRAAGLSNKQIQLRASSGELARVSRDLYRIHGAAETYEQRVMLACLASDGVASHRCAAALWNLRRCESRLVEITMGDRRHRKVPGAVIHSTNRLRGADMTVLRAIPVTSPARTLLDLGSVAPSRVVESAVEDALQRRLVTLEWLERTVGRVGGPGRNGSGVLRQVLESRPRDAAPTESVLEDAIVRLLLAGGLPPPVRQHPIPRAGGEPLRLDLSYPSVRLAIEGQSVTWHTGRESLQRDCDKLNLLITLGWRVLVFTWQDVRRRPHFVVSTVASELSRTLAP